jgi:hypothetical protein
VPDGSGVAFGEANPTFRLTSSIISGEATMNRERALKIVLVLAGLLFTARSCSADNVFLARACGANANEHLRHTRNFLATGGA